MLKKGEERYVVDELCTSVRYNNIEGVLSLVVILSYIGLLHLIYKITFDFVCY